MKFASFSVWTVHFDNGHRMHCTPHEAKRFASNAKLAKRIKFIEFQPA